MSFLRKMFSGDLKKDDPRRFLVEAMLGAMEADGEVSDEEMDVLSRNLSQHELFKGLTGDATSRLVDIAADAIREAGGGQKRAVAIAKGLPSRSHRLTAYALACEVCVSDDTLPEGEIRYLETLQQELGVSDDEAREIFEGVRQRSGLMTLEEKTDKMRQLMPRFVDCMALMAAADGEVHDSEMVGVRAVLRNIPDMAVLSENELDDAIQAAFGRIRQRTPDAELETIASAIANPADRYWTMVYMMIVALTDGKTDWREVGFLHTAQKLFTLSDAQMDHAMTTASLFPATKLGGAAPQA
jgi:uncharacterized tellurite resistance protein B-like protein